jgi:outer membrane protein OmpA-like peptidoglycan-associated protein
VVLVASGTANEPRPVVGERVIGLLHAAADSQQVTDHTVTTSSVALVSTTTGAAQAVTLSPRRADGAIEHGLSRQSLIEDNVDAVRALVASATATSAELDLLSGIADAVRGVRPGTVVVVSSGLSTSGAFDLRQVGWAADADAVAAQLLAAGQLPDLHGWHVIFSGLGATSAPQPPLPLPTRTTLTGYWQAICRAAGARHCDVDETRTTTTRSAATVATPVVPVPGVTSVTGPDRTTTTTFSNDVLGFTGDSAVLSADARELLGATATAIGGRLGATVTVRGFTADPPGSTAGGRQRLAEARAHAVAVVLDELGVDNPIVAVGVGAPPDTTAIVDGRFVEQVATQMRRVEIHY